VMFSKVHCSYISLGQSLMREGHVDNFLLTVFCRKLFEDKHPSISGRHHFFSLVGVSKLVQFLFCIRSLLSMCFTNSFLFNVICLDSSSYFSWLFCMLLLCTAGKHLGL
jgi:hypothetical protein